MKSELRHVGTITFPAYTGARVMMMPFLLEDLATLPLYASQVAAALPCDLRGTAYLTVDEALVLAGETHRRPGLHVDGIGEDGSVGSWGGGGGGYASNGMYVAASDYGCVAHNQDFIGSPRDNGDCEHLRPQIDNYTAMIGGHVYWCSSLCVHESVPMRTDTLRQFMRISMPSNAPWHEGYTESPYGVKPTGQILPARKQFMAYRG